MGRSPPRDGVHRAVHPVGQLVNTSQHSHPGKPCGLCGPMPPRLRPYRSKTPPPRPPLAAHSARSLCETPAQVGDHASRSMRPRICRKRVGVKWLSAGCKMKYRAADEPPAGLEQPLLQARQRPALDGERQDQPSQEIAEVVGDDPEEQPHLVGSEPVAGEPRPVGRGLALFDPLLRRPAPVGRRPGWSRSGWSR
jgi:hypothetical protein